MGLEAPVVRRIRVLTVIAAIAGALVLTGVVWGALYDLRIVDVRPIAADPNPDADSPWEFADPPELAIAEDGTLAVPAGGGVLHIERDAATPVLQVAAAADPADWIDISITPADQDPRDEYFYPDDVGYIASESDVAMLFPGERDLEVWFESDAQETLRISPVEATTFTSAASGEGDAVLLYEGDHISARAVHRGDGVFYVDTFTPASSDSPIIDSGRIDQRFSWDEGGPLVIRVQSTDGPWTIEIEGESGAPVSVPSSAQTDPAG